MKAKIKNASARRKTASDSSQKKLFLTMEEIQIRAQTVTPILKAITGYPL